MGRGECPCPGLRFRQQQPPPSPRQGRVGQHRLMIPADLLVDLRAKAAELREVAAEGPAAGIDWCVKQLERFIEEQDARLLNLQEAAELSGYSPDHLGRMVRDGKIPNAGRSRAPRIRLKDLPRKPNRVAAEVAPDRSSHEIGSATAIVRSVIIQGG